MIGAIGILLLNILPIVFWFWWFERRDPIPEPRLLLLRTFGYGALALCGAALIEMGLKPIVPVPIMLFFCGGY